MSSLSVAPWQLLTLTQAFEQFALYGGLGTGKSFIGANWCIDRLRERPDQKGFIGANSHQQLGQVALHEFFEALARARFSYIVNSRPPLSWQPRIFEDYKGIITVKVAAKLVTNIFTRVLQRGDLLRGIEFGWYWIDETRDTPEYTHDVLMGRLRGDKEWKRGLVTTTTNGKDWSYKRFVAGAKLGSRLYGSAHVSTAESVKYGIVSQSYLDTLLASYSALMAEQEIYARHVNIKTGRAYHGFQEDHNARRRAPWGDTHPDLARPLIVGCDFNFSPAPCIWMVGQLGPEGWDHCLHWFGELAHTETGTESMTAILIQQFPGFFYQVFGDSSGERGSTSNAGETDYMQMAGVFEEAGVRGYSIDSDQANPFVKDRVESVNALLTNGLGEHRMTYNPDACPHLHEDFEVVGYNSQGKLAGDNEQHTHASDGAGYAVYKLFGPNSMGVIEEGVRSADR